VSTWERLAELPVQIDEYSLEGLQASVSSDFERKSTLIRLRGGAHEGIGEDVTYDAVDQEIMQAAGPVLELTGRFTLASFCARLTELSLFPEPPQKEVSSRYRAWAYESAALDLALRQAQVALHEVLAREPRPLLRKVATSTFWNAASGPRPARILSSLPACAQVTWSSPYRIRLLLLPKRFRRQGLCPSLWILANVPTT